MFDTIIKKECSCRCEDVLCPHCYSFYPQNPIKEQMAYDRGFIEGRKSGYEMAMDDYKMRFRSMDDQEKFTAKLKEAMKPLEELKKELGI